MKCRIQIMGETNFRKHMTYLRIGKMLVYNQIPLHGYKGVLDVIEHACERLTKILGNGSTYSYILNCHVSSTSMSSCELGAKHVCG